MADVHYSSTASLSFPRPRSPPKYPDLSGKRRELAKVQMLEREIGFLEEELKSCDSLRPASRSCKEVDDFVGANPDPLIQINMKIRRSTRFWKWLCGKPCFSLSWIRCFGGCSLHPETLNCCACCPSANQQCCHLPKCCYCCCCCRCLGKTSCRCCTLPAPSCPSCSCCPNCSSCLNCPSCRCSCPSFKCTKVLFCSNCAKTWCNPCCLFY